MQNAIKGERDETVVMNDKESYLSLIQAVSEQGPFKPDWESLKAYTIPAWYQDAKFGIFIHWGLYSIQAYCNEWYPRNMYQQDSEAFKHHVETYGPQDQFGYKDFIPLFKAEKYDPVQWAELFLASGAKYVVPVAEHHDGFAMYDCGFSKWNAKLMGPERDIIGELAETVRERGLTFGVSSHRAEHNWFMDGGKQFPSDVQDPEFEDFYGPAEPHPEDHHNVELGGPGTEFLEDWLIRTCELIDKYQPRLLWFDWWIQNLQFKPYLKKMAAYYYNRGVESGFDAAINYKYDAFPEGTAVFDIERGQLSGIREEFWQTDTSLSKKSWSYIENNEYKTVTSIIQDLIDIVSKNGSLLLNVGPKADGTIPEQERDMLLKIGQWLTVNGEAIYGTRPWRIFGEGPTEVEDGAFTDTKRSEFTGEDIRFTTKDGNLYAIALAWPGRELLIRSFAGIEVAGAELLGCPQSVKWEQTDQGVRVHLPEERPCEDAFTVKVSVRN